MVVGNHFQQARDAAPLLSYLRSQGMCYRLILDDKGFCLVLHAVLLQDARLRALAHGATAHGFTIQPCEMPVLSSNQASQQANNHLYCHLSVTKDEQMLKTLPPAVSVPSPSKYVALAGETCSPETAAYALKHRLPILRATSKPSQRLPAEIRPYPSLSGGQGEIALAADRMPTQAGPGGLVSDRSRDITQYPGHYLPVYMQGYDAYAEEDDDSRYVLVVEDWHRFIERVTQPHEAYTYESGGKTHEMPADDGSSMREYLEMVRPQHSRYSLEVWDAWKHGKDTGHPDVDVAWEAGDPSWAWHPTRNYSLVAMRAAAELLAKELAQRGALRVLQGPSVFKSRGLAVRRRVLARYAKGLVSAQECNAYIRYALNLANCYNANALRARLDRVARTAERRERRRPNPSRQGRAIVQAALSRRYSKESS